MSKTVLLTGGAGYIGSHTAVELLKAGYQVVIFDDFSNAHPRVILQIERLSNQKVTVAQGDVRESQALNALFARHQIDGVIHFAGLKAVGESVQRPTLYYDVNVTGSLKLMEAMDTAGVGALVFSSSATVYGEPDVVPLTEAAPYQPESPYGRSKMMVEQAMADAAQSPQTSQNCAYLSLRYFNPVGAHESGEMGEDPEGIPGNLFPYIAQVAVGRRSHLTIFGDDYPTPDGTGVRDYIHVMDLAQGHVAAINHVLANPGMGFDALNLGTGVGSSVRQVCHAFEQASGRTIPQKIGPRRAGDVPAYWADPAKAWTVLGWRATRDLDAMCADGWRWQSTYPQGYAGMDV